MGCDRYCRKNIHDVIVYKRNLYTHIHNIHMYVCVYDEHTCGNCLTAFLFCLACRKGLEAGVDPVMKDKNMHDVIVCMMHVLACEAVLYGMYIHFV